MGEEKLKHLLNELAERATEPVRPGLSEDIKHQIPHRLTRHKIGWDTINIIIDLRMSKSVATVVIIVATIILLNFFGSHNSVDGGILQDSMWLIKYLGGTGRSDTSVGRLKYEHLINTGKDATWYGNGLDPKDSNAVLMQRKLTNGKYEVMFVDGREKQVSAEELVELLTRMLQKKTK